MATRGFEFAYMIDGSNHGPLIRDWPMAADTAGYKAGDLLVCDTAGRADKAAANAATIFGVCQETDTATTEDEELKIAIVTRGQVWRCSSDSTSLSAVKVYNAACDIVDENTYDASSTSGGSLILLDSGTDEDGNAIAYVLFNNTFLDGTS